jgi:hypothetical protein
MGFAFAALRRGAESWWMVPIRTSGLAEAAMDKSDKARNFMMGGWWIEQGTLTNKREKKEMKYNEKQK